MRQSRDEKVINIGIELDQDSPQTKGIYDSKTYSDDKTLFVEDPSTGLRISHRCARVWEELSSNSTTMQSFRPYTTNSGFPVRD